MFVSQWLSQSEAISIMYSSNGGMEDRVTRMFLSGINLASTKSNAVYSAFSDRFIIISRSVATM